LQEELGKSAFESAFFADMASFMRLQMEKPR